MDEAVPGDHPVPGNFRGATYATENRALFQRWLAKHVELGEKAADALQPLWSKPHSKPVSFQDARSKSHERLGQILGELGLKQ